MNVSVELLTDGLLVGSPPSTRPPAGAVLDCWLLYIVHTYNSTKQRERARTDTPRAQNPTHTQGSCMPQTSTSHALKRPGEEANSQN